MNALTTDPMSSTKALPMTLDPRLESFDDLFVGDPRDIENNLNELLPGAQALENKSIYLQMLSQIALAQAMQKNFDTAHKTLDTAEKMLTLEYPLARVRILIERGRVFWQSGDNERALPFFKQAFELSGEQGFDAHTINAAHLYAIVIPIVAEKIHWNEQAITLAESSTSKSGRAWLSALYNNLGQDYLKIQEYAKALAIFKKALDLFTGEGSAPHIRFAKWTVAHTLRLLGRADEALSLLRPLLEETQLLILHNKLDLPKDMMLYARGEIYADLAEIDQKQSKLYAQLACEDLSHNEWVQKLAPEKLERLQELQQKDSYTIREK